MGEKDLWRDLFAREPHLRDMWASFERDRQDHLVARAKADPKKYKLTTIFPDGTNYHYWPAGMDGRNRKVHFCWSTKRNAAGYFLTWREVIGKDNGKRDMWSARKTKSACAEIARRRQNAFIDKHNTDASS